MEQAKSVAKRIRTSDRLVEANVVAAYRIAVEEQNQAASLVASQAAFDKPASHSNQKATEELDFGNKVAGKSEGGFEIQNWATESQSFVLVFLVSFEVELGPQQTKNFQNFETSESTKKQKFFVHGDGLPFRKSPYSQLQQFAQGCSRIRIPHLVTLSQFCLSQWKS